MWKFAWGFRAKKSIRMPRYNYVPPVASCHLSRSGLTEANVILARAGHFDLTEEQVDKMMICPQHRHNLGRYWRPPRSCQYQTHNGPWKKQCNDRHAIGVATAKEIQSVCKVTVGIGSRKDIPFVKYIDRVIHKGRIINLNLIVLEEI